jgi:hypothetical protein
MVVLILYLLTQNTEYNLGGFAQGATVQEIGVPYPAERKSILLLNLLFLDHQLIHLRVHYLLDTN